MASDEPNAELQLLADSARSFYARHHDDARALQLRADGGFDSEAWNRMAEAGWLAARVPEPQGGLGLGPADAAAMLVEAGRAGASDPLITGCFIPSAILSKLQTEAASEALEAIAEGGAPFALATGREPLDLNEEALTFDILGPGDRVLCLMQAGGKQSIRMMDRLEGTVTRLADGTPLLSCTVETAALRRSAPIAEGEACNAAWRAGMREGAVLASAQLTGCAAALLELTIDHCRQRIQFGQPIAGFQVIRHRIVDMQIAHQLALVSCAHALAAQRHLDLAAHAAKARCSAAAIDIARAAIQLHGAIGFTEESRTAPLVRQAMSLSAMFGTAAYHQAEAARLMNEAEMEA